MNARCRPALATPRAPCSALARHQTVWDGSLGYATRPACANGPAELDSHAHPKLQVSLSKAPRLRRIPGSRKLDAFVARPRRHDGVRWRSLGACMRTGDGAHDSMRLVVRGARSDARGRVPCGQRACESVSRVPDPRLSRSRGRAHIVLLGGLSVEQVGMVCVLGSRTKGTVLKLHNQEMLLPFRMIMPPW